MASPFLSCSMAVKETHTHTHRSVSGLQSHLFELLRLLSVCERDDAAGRDGGLSSNMHTWKEGRDSLSLVGRGFFSFVSVFFSLALSKRAISVMSGLSDILAAVDDTQKLTCLTLPVQHRIDNTRYVTHKRRSLQSSSIHLSCNVS